MNFKLYLNEHKRRVHDKELNHFCDQCDFSTFEAFKLKGHKQSRHGDAIFKCDKCSYKARAKNRLNKHVLTKHMKMGRMKCTHCTQSFDYQGTMENHMWNEHGIIFKFKHTNWKKS